MFESDGPPSFDSAFDGEDVEQRIYGVVLETREPVAVSVIADDADCDPKTARKYLGWFADLGVVTKHDGRPTTYERNDAYFEWRRVNELASTHSLGSLQSRVSELTEKIEAYRDTYNAATPSDVDVLDRTDRDVERTYEDLSDWKTALEERRRYERARQQVSDSTVRTQG